MKQTRDKVRKSLRAVAESFTSSDVEDLRDVIYEIFEQQRDLESCLREFLAASEKVDFEDVSDALKADNLWYEVAQVERIEEVRNRAKEILNEAD